MDDNTLLNNYFNGLLSAEDVRAVEARLTSDPEFEAEFLLRREMEAFPRKAAERDHFIETLQTIGSEFFQVKASETPPLTVARSNVRRWLALAASITLIAAAVWFFTKGNEPTYQAYARHAALSLTSMGNTEQARSAAESAFNQQNFAGALAALDQVLAAEPNNVKAVFYRGICLLELDKTSEARTVFESLAAGNSALSEDALWYVSLSYLKEKNKPACKASLLKIQAGNPHFKAAQELLKAL